MVILFLVGFHCLIFGVDLNILYFVPSFLNKGPINVIYNIVYTLLNNSTSDVNKIVIVSLSNGYDYEMYEKLKYLGVDFFFLDTKFNIFKIKKIFFILMAKYNFDVIHSNCFLPDVLSLFINHTNKVSTIHCNYFKEYEFKFGFLGKIFSFLHKYSLNRFKKRICISNSLKTELLQHDSSVAYTVVNNGIIKDINYKKGGNNISIPNSNYNIVFVGTLDKNKNPELLLRAMSLMRLNEDYTVNFLGSGELMPKLLDKYSKFKYNIFFHGHIKNVSDFYEKSNLFVLCSKREGFGLAYAEALQFGCDTLVSDIPAFNEILSEKTNRHDKFKVNLFFDFYSKLENILSLKGNCEVLNEDFYNSIDANRMALEYIDEYLNT